MHTSSSNAKSIITKSFVLMRGNYVQRPSKHLQLTFISAHIPFKASQSLTKPKHTQSSSRKTVVISHCLSRKQETCEEQRGIQGVGRRRRRRVWEHKAGEEWQSNVNQLDPCYSWCICSYLFTSFSAETDYMSCTTKPQASVAKTAGTASMITWPSVVKWLVSD